MSNTPGPWVTDGAEVYADDGMTWLGEFLALSPADDANARLAAAAPDLLEVCEQVREVVLLWSGPGLSKVGPLLSVLDSAIAKATGEDR